MLGLIVFSGFVVDYGVLWQSRRQAQNAADAGALAGAIARINDDQNPNPSTTSGMVYESIVNTVGFNPIWGLAPPANTVAMDWNCPDGTTNCVHVDVFRDGTHGSTTLPTFVMKVANIQSQGIKAHAIAQLVPANGTGCMRPWFMIDKYTDVNGDGMYTSPPDVYDGNVQDAGRPVSQGGSSPYTGYQVPWDVGLTVTFHANLGPSGYGQVDVGSGGNAINDAIENCVGNQVYKIGDVVPVKPGSTNGPEQQGVQQLIDWDPGSSVQVTTYPGGLKSATVINSCAPNCTCPGNLNSVCPNGPGLSPRVAIVPVCEPTDPGCASGGTNNNTITIKEFLSFYILSYSGNGNNLDITATLLSSAGQIVPMGGGTPGGTTPPAGAFLKTVVLIR
jgi:putative Flp pilus-assembly TadE/G-like protein